MDYYISEEVHHRTSDLLMDVVEAIADCGYTRIPARVEIIEVDVLKHTRDDWYDEYYGEYMAYFDVDVISTYRIDY